MSNFEFLEQKLKFLRGFYETTTHPFREIRRKINGQEEPYVPVWNGEEPDGDPPFVDDYSDAMDGLRLQEQLCLNLLQRSLKEFLDSTVKEHQDFPKNQPPKGGNWFEHYQEWFKDECGIDWTQAGVDLSRLEELTLARNCVQHGGESDKGPGQQRVFDSYDLLKRQSVNYHERFPDAFFGNEEEKRIWNHCAYPQPVLIELTPDKLNTAINDITVFCQYINDHLPAWMWG